MIIEMTMDMILSFTLTAIMIIMIAEMTVEMAMITSVTIASDYFYYYACRNDNSYNNFYDNDLRQFL